MTQRRTEEDFLVPARTFNRLINDYSEGRLTKSWLKLYRARVEAVDTEGGQLEDPPRNPPNSIRARVYSSGLDVNLPSSALSVFHPLLPGHLAPPLSPGEHVYVFFEDAAMTHGLWVSPISSYHNLNFSDPDQRESSERNSSNVFEGDSSRPSQPSRIYEYGGATIETQGRQEIIDDFETSGQSNPWENKRVLVIGDSQVWGSTREDGTRNPLSALSSVLERKLFTEHRVTFFMAQGRVGWGVENWVSRTTRGARRGLALPQPSLSDLINQFSADALIIVLGGNDASNGSVRQSDYEQSVSDLWQQANSISLKIWAGPPVAVGESADIQPGRSLVARKIRSVVGNNFVDSSVVTNTTDGRDRLGIHFTPSSSAIEPWASLIIRKGYQL